jgi:hypothetical protein
MSTFGLYAFNKLKAIFECNELELDFDILNIEVLSRNDYLLDYLNEDSIGSISTMEKMMLYKKGCKDANIRSTLQKMHFLIILDILNCYSDSTEKLTTMDLLIESHFSSLGSNKAEVAYNVINELITLSDKRNKNITYIEMSELLDISIIELDQIFQRKGFKKNIDLFLYILLKYDSPTVNNQMLIKLIRYHFTEQKHLTNVFTKNWNERLEELE